MFCVTYVSIVGFFIAYQDMNIIQVFGRLLSDILFIYLVREI